MKNKIFNIFSLTLGTFFILTLLTALYAWQKFLTDPTIVTSNFFVFWKQTFYNVLQVLSFNFGASTTYGNISVSKIIFTFLPHTLILVLGTVILTAILSIIYGFIIFLKENYQKKFSKYGLVIGASIPSFLLAKVIYIFFNGKFSNSEFPKGLYWMGYAKEANAGIQIVFSYLIYLLLPILILLISDGNLYHFFSLIKRKIHELFKAPFVEYKLIRGYSKPYVFFKHILPHLLLLFIYQLKYRFVYLISAAAVVEIVFQRDGIGSRLIEFAQINTTDIKLLIGILYIISLIIILMQIILLFLESNFQKVVLSFHWISRKIMMRLSKFPIPTIKMVKYDKNYWRKYAKLFFLLVLITLLFWKILFNYQAIGVDPRYIKNGMALNQEFTELKQSLVDGWGNIDSGVMQKLAKFKYNTYVNMMNIDISVLVKAGLDSLIIGIVTTILALLFGLPIGLFLGYTKKIFLKNFMNQFFIGPFDIIPKFFILAIFLSVLLYSPVSHSDSLFLLVYIVILAFLHIPEVSKMISLEVETVKKKGFYISGLAIGVSLKRKIFVYILKNIKSRIFIESMRVFISVIFLEATLSYFGFYVPIKKNLYFVTLGSVINRYSMTLNFLSNDWAVTVVKIFPLALATMLLISIIGSAQFILQKVLSRRNEL